MRKKLTIIAVVIVDAILLYWEFIVLPRGIRTIVGMFPETGRLAAPGLFWEITAISCLQIVSVVILRNTLCSRISAAWEIVRLIFLSMFMFISIAANITVGLMGFPTAGAIVPLSVLTVISAVGLWRCIIRWHNNITIATK
ncbi:hypothetical protein KIH79_08925 [Bifidobacterium sp. 82T10]|uniref:Uncharacterized protein n=1 Tax=Bifidobacterium miconis TaxID=2834435 RepID=A0ABS6WG52_9BIFI|nr:hypothetical protein [Bifidobacterium miconis]MBW3093041.1 hypothetical protein [Bifidobacterium miconis]